MRFASALSLACLALAGCNRGASASFRTEEVTRGPISEMVSATGDVSAIVTVNIGSQVSGIVSKLYVDFNSQVKKGQPLADLDPRLFRATLERAQAGLASAQADVEKAQAQLNDAVRVEKRTKELLEQKLVSQQDVDSAVANREQMAANLSGTKAKVLQARADRDMAAANLEFARIKSPIDGIVVSRAVDVGQTVAASFQTPTMFTIANDLTKMQVLAHIDEANPEHKLRQGMTAAVKVLTGHKDDVLRVSNAALRWKPENAAAPEAPAQQAPRGDRTMARTERRTTGGAGSPAPGKPARLYKLVAGKPVPVDVRIGISDGQRTEVLSGLAENDAVVVGDLGAGGARPQGTRRGPF